MAASTGAGSIHLAGGAARAAEAQQTEGGRGDMRADMEEAVVWAGGMQQDVLAASRWRRSESGRHAHPSEPVPIVSDDNVRPEP